MDSGIDDSSIHVYFNVGRFYHYVLRGVCRSSPTANVRPLHLLVTLDSRWSVWSVVLSDVGLRLLCYVYVGRTYDSICPASPVLAYLARRPGTPGSLLMVMFHCLALLC